MKLSDMSTDDLTYRRSEIVAEIKLYLFVRLTDAEKEKLRKLKKVKKQYDSEIQTRQMTLF